MRKYPQKSTLYSKWGPWIKAGILIETVLFVGCGYVWVKMCRSSGK